MATAAVAAAMLKSRRLPWRQVATIILPVVDKSSRGVISGSIPQTIEAAAPLPAQRPTHGLAIAPLLHSATKSSGFPLSRFRATIGACMHSLAAATTTDAKNAGLSTTPTSTSVRSPSAPAIRTIRSHGNGVAVSIRALVRANAPAAPQRPSTKRARFRSGVAGFSVKAHGGRFSCMARPARLDRAEICGLGSRQTDAEWLTVGRGNSASRSSFRTGKRSSPCATPLPGLPRQSRNRSTIFARFKPQRIA
jgi:hypothetical protein